MRLEGDFYKVHTIEQVEDNYKIEVELFEDHPVYKGHFPQQPVVPGVCTLTVIKECIGKILSDNVSFSSIKECKYVSALIPQQGLRIIINLAIADGDKVIATVVRVDNQQLVLKLKASLKSYE